MVTDPRKMTLLMKEDKTKCSFQLVEFSKNVDILTKGLAVL